MFRKKTEAKPKTVATSVTHHAWNADGSMIALSPNSAEVWIFATNGQEDNTKWEKKYVLTEHTGHVSAIDWCAETNALVTCSHDRNAYVWKYEAKTDEWKPDLVILRINRAATSVKWSPNGVKFAVSSGAKCVPVCRYEEQSSWWISKMIKRHKSTVMCLDWCPNNKFVITGSTDNKCRVFSAFLEELDDPEDDGFGQIWPNQHEFGEVLCEFDMGRAWVHDVAWSMTGFRMAYAGHGSSVTFVQLVAESDPIVQHVEHKGLPFLGIQFASNDAVVAAGWDCNPALFTASGDAADPTWAFNRELDSKEEKKAAPKKKANAFSNAFSKFSSAASRGTRVEDTVQEVTLNTRHQNTIIEIKKFPGRPGVYSTTSIDGYVLFWDLAKIGVDCGSLGIE